MNKELLQLLACPRCRGTLTLLEEQGEERGLSCAACAVMYPIRDQIPIMLVEEAVPLNAASSTTTSSTTTSSTTAHEQGSTTSQGNEDGACACS